MLETRALLEKMIGFRPVTSEVENVNLLVDFLNGYLQAEGVTTVVEESGGRKILYASTAGTTAPRILLNSHLDVVPADDRLWQVRRDDDWLCGRGTHDCLGNSAVLAQLLCRARSDADVGVIFSADEEVGGTTTGVMAERGYRGRELIVIADGSGYSIVIAQKGMLDVRLQARGAGCHAAMPWQGRNAIDLLVDGYLKVRQMFPAITPPDEWHDTMAATTINAGTVHNRVPEEAAMNLNIRITEGTDPHELVRKIAEVSGLEAVVEMECPPVFCDREAPAIRELEEHMRRCLGREIEIKRSNGATDARHFVSANVPIAIIGIPGRGLHAQDEAVSLKGLAEYEEMLVEFAGGHR